jgi:DNA-binding NarL/FixJ family response regulator
MNEEINKLLLLKPFYVYALHDENDHDFFYIGKGQDARLFQHAKEARRCQSEKEKNKKILEIERSGHKVKQTVIGRFDSDAEAFAIESTLIHWVYGIDNLTNIASGHGANFIRPRNNFSYIPALQENALKPYYVYALINDIKHSIFYAFVKQMIERKPDIFLLDQVILRDMVALDLERVLSYRNKFPTMNTIIVGKRFNEENVMAMMMLHKGVRGFFRITQDDKHLIKCIRNVARGEFWLDATLTTRIIAELIKECMKKKDRLKYLTQLGKAKMEMLSPREMEILELLSHSMTNEEIAEELSLSEETVKTHLHKIFKKAGIRNRVEAALAYTRHALISY